MLTVGLTIALTLLLTFGAFLFFPTVNAPPLFARVAIALCAAEFLAVFALAGGPAVHRPRLPDAVARRAHRRGHRHPRLTALMLVLAAVYGLRVARSW